MVRGHHPILRRLVGIPPTLLLISVLIFSLAHLAPGDPLSFMLGVEAPPDVVEATRARYQFDRPIPEQYLIWLGSTIRGDFGRSIMTGQTVTLMIAERLPVTATLAITAALFSWLFAFPAGIVAAVRRGSRLDYAVSLLSTVGMSVPDFILSLVLILVFAVTLRILPSTSYTAPWVDPIDWARHIVLPAIALGAIQTALLARMMRASVLEVLGEDYIRTARSKGLRETVVLRRHALKNALIPVVTTATINIGQLLGGSIIVEQVFAIPGMGRLLVDAILRRDYPLIQGITLVIGISYICANLAADLVYTRLDPQAST